MNFLKGAIAFVCLCSLLSCASGGRSGLDLNPVLDDSAQLAKLCGEGATSACALIGKEALATRTLPILQGLTSHQQSRFVVQVPKASAVAYYLRGPGGLKRIEHERQLLKGTSSALDRMEVFDLKLGPEYELIVAGPDGVLWDLRKFSAVDLGKKKAKVVIASCMDESFREVQKAIWAQVLAQKPDAIFLIGDNVYANQPARITSEEQIFRRYAEAREAIDLFRAPKLVPILATWDDNDYGMNDGDRTWLFKPAVTGAFFGFFPQEKAGAEFQRGPGISSWWRAFGVNFALLDNRSFRSPNGLDLPDQTHFGAEQEKWIQQGITAAREPVLLVSGDQFFGEYKLCESYESNHPRSLSARLKDWRKSPVPLLFVSGDRHLADINSVPKALLGFPTYEITSSAIHARVYPDSFERCPSPHQVVGIDGAMNYMLVQIQRATRKQLSLDVRSFGENGKLHFQKTLVVNR